MDIHRSSSFSIPKGIKTSLRGELVWIKECSNYSTQQHMAIIVSMVLGEIVTQLSCTVVQRDHLTINSVRIDNSSGGNLWYGLWLCTWELCQPILSAK